MHEDFKAFSQKPTQKFHNNFINFENLQKYFKNPKTYVYYMKCIKNEGFRNFPSNKKLD